MPQFLADHALWPLCLTLAEGRQSADHHRQMLEAWDGWFARGQPFFALRIYLDAAALEQIPGSGATTKQWLGAGAAENMKRLTAAMAIAVPPDSYDPASRPSVEKVFGIPGGIFPGPDEALRWLSRIEGFPVGMGIKVQEIVEEVRGSGACK